MTFKEYRETVKNLTSDDIRSLLESLSEHISIADDATGKISGWFENGGHADAIDAYGAFLNYALAGIESGDFPEDMRDALGTIIADDSILDADRAAAMMGRYMPGTQDFSFTEQPTGPAEPDGGSTAGNGNGDGSVVRDEAYETTTGFVSNAFQTVDIQADGVMAIIRDAVEPMGDTGDRDIFDPDNGISQDAYEIGRAHV